MVQYVTGGARVGSVHWSNGSRSRKSGIAASVLPPGPQRNLRLLWLDAEDDEGFPRQPLLEALMVEQVLLAPEPNLPGSLVSDPPARSFAVELRQVALERLQGLLFQCCRLLCCHLVFLRVGDKMGSLFRQQRPAGGAESPTPSCYPVRRQTERTISKKGPAHRASR